MTTIIINEVGNTHGRWTVLKHIKKPSQKSGGVYWLCQCICGNTSIILGSSLRRGNSKSCGCLRKELRILPHGEAAFNTLLRDYQSSAKRRQLSFKLTKGEFQELVKQNCHYCGRKPEKVKYGPTKTSGNYVYNGLDRMDNKEGYVIENVVPCCFLCNRAKNSLSYTKFRNWIKQCVLHYLKEEESV